MAEMVDPFVGLWIWLAKVISWLADQLEVYL